MATVEDPTAPAAIRDAHGDQLHVLLLTGRTRADRWRWWALAPCAARTAR